MVTGRNREFIEAKIPHLSRLMLDSSEELVAWADTVVVGHREPAYADLLSRGRGTTNGRAVIDLAGLSADWYGEQGYHGVCW
jgi:GDP-mannose 6-dehydrogenase